MRGFDESGVNICGMGDLTYYCSFILTPTK